MMICGSLSDMDPSAVGQHLERAGETDFPGDRLTIHDGATGSDQRLVSFLVGEIRSLHAALRRLERELELSRQKEARASYDAQHDALTGLPNRILLDRWLDRVLDPSLADIRCVAMFIDMDRFKTVNDAHGHQAGDQLLKAVGRRIVEAVQDVALVARYAGDEFVVLLPDQACPAAARRLAERLIRSLCRPFDLDGVVVEVGASVGVAVAPPHGIQKRVLLEQADAALYAAKACGGGNVQVFQTGATYGAKREG